MADLVEKTGLQFMLHEEGVAYTPGDNFELLYASVTRDLTKADLARRIEGRIRDYFAEVQLPDTATLYDRLLLSLRPKDCVATFNWDPLLCQAFKRNRDIAVLPRLLFLHGNVDVGACVEHKQKGFLEHDCPRCRAPLKPVPLLYPIYEKNYEGDPFIASEWREFGDFLNEAYLLTIVGYSAPASDVAAKDAMLAAWNANGSQDLAQIEIIDKKSREEVESTWRPFFVREHYSVSGHLTSIFRRPRRSCDHFAMASLQQNPCRDRPLPETDDLATLRAAIAPLIAEENALETEGTPFPC